MADLPQHCIRRLPPAARQGDTCDRCGNRPALLLVDATVTDARAEREAAWRRWGPDLPVVEVSRATPIARVWLAPTHVQVVEIGPGFLAPYLPSSPPLRRPASQQ
jgi:hypothetical protein